MTQLPFDEDLRMHMFVSPDDNPALGPSAALEAAAADLIDSMDLMVMQPTFLFFFENIEKSAILFAHLMQTHFLILGCEKIQGCG
jgi:hypothetical protein